MLPFSLGHDVPATSVQLRSSERLPAVNRFGPLIVLVLVFVLDLPRSSSAAGPPAPHCHGHPTMAWNPWRCTLLHSFALNCTKFCNTHHRAAISPAHLPPQFLCKLKPPPWNPIPPSRSTNGTTVTSLGSPKRSAIKSSAIQIPASRFRHPVPGIQNPSSSIQNCTVSAPKTPLCRYQIHVPKKSQQTPSPNGTAVQRQPNDSPSPWGCGRSLGEKTDPFLAGWGRTSFQLNRPAKRNLRTNR